MGEIEVKGFKVECENCGESVWSGTAFKCSDCETIICKECNEEVQEDNSSDLEVVSMQCVASNVCGYCGKFTEV